MDPTETDLRNLFIDASKKNPQKRLEIPEQYRPTPLIEDDGSISMEVVPTTKYDVIVAVVGLIAMVVFGFGIFCAALVPKAPDGLIVWTVSPGLLTLVIVTLYRRNWKWWIMGGTAVIFGFVVSLTVAVMNGGSIIR